MRDVDINNIAVMYMTVHADKERVNEDPPELPFIIANNPESKGYALDSFKQNAYKFDMYTDIIQLSFLYRDNFVHTLFCGDTDVQINEPITDGPRVITTTDTEEELIRNSVAFINQIHQETKDGIVVSPSIFVGWKLTSDIWPMLINKALAYGIRMPQSLMSDPLRRFPILDSLLDVSNIYAQGAHAVVRRLPALSDALRYWGYRGSDEVKRHPSPEEVIDTVCSSPVTAAGVVEPYLRDMYSMVCRYYGQGEGYGIE